MSEKSFDEFLAGQLQAKASYIDDDGFTARLMGQLPAPKRIKPWLETLITWLPVTLISLVVLSQLPWRPLVQPVYAWMLTMNMASLLCAALVLCAACVLVPLSLLVKDRFI